MLKLQLNISKTLFTKGDFPQVKVTLRESDDYELVEEVEGEGSSNIRSVNVGVQDSQAVSVPVRLLSHGYVKFTVVAEGTSKADAVTGTINVKVGLFYTTLQTFCKI